jgi:hypothetical protein
MPILPVLFAFRTSLAVILSVVVVGLVVWYIIRAVVDAIRWFRDEMVDEYRDLRKNSRKLPIDERRVEDVFSEDRRVEEGTSNGQRGSVPKRS